MGKLLKNKFLVILVSILLLAFFLRAYNLTNSPRLGATFDEFAWTWIGISLIQEHVPSSWSPHPQYEGHREYKKYLNADFWIVKPYLEHPPFFGLVAGSFAILNGADGMFDVTLDKIRPLALILGLVSIGTLFLLVREIYDEKIALLSTLIYATIPTVVIGSRLVQNENFFIPIYLSALFLIAKYFRTKNKKLIYMSAVLCGLLVISKVPWIAASVGIISILFYKQKYNLGLRVGLIVALFFIGYLIYGLFFNSDLFLGLWGLQLQRYDISFNSVYALFTEPYLTDRYFIDGWIFFGWFAFILLLIKDYKKNIVVILGLLAYLGIFIFAIPNEAGHGWYRYPFYPFLAISVALFIKEYFNKNILLTFLFILLVGLSMLEVSYGTKFGFSFLVFRGFLFVCALSLLPLFFRSNNLLKFSHGLNFILLIGVFGLNVLAVLTYLEI